MSNHTSSASGRNTFNKNRSCIEIISRLDSLKIHTQFNKNRSCIEIRISLDLNNGFAV